MWWVVAAGVHRRGAVFRTTARVARISARIGRALLGRCAFDPDTKRTPRSDDEIAAFATGDESSLRRTSLGGETRAAGFGALRESIDVETEEVATLVRRRRGRSAREYLLEGTGTGI